MQSQKDYASKTGINTKEEKNLRLTLGGWLLREAIKAGKRIEIPSLGISIETKEDAADRKN